MLSSLIFRQQHHVFLSVRAFWLQFLATLAVLCSSATAAAPLQEPETPNSERGPKNEQTIYIPYDKLRDVFEKEGRGVFLPYDQFQKLWQEARSAKGGSPADSPPVDVILVSAENTATIEKEVMVVRAVITVELLRTGWQKISSNFSSAGPSNPNPQPKSSGVFRSGPPNAF